MKVKGIYDRSLLDGCMEEQAPSACPRPDLSSDEIEKQSKRVSDLQV